MRRIGRQRTGCRGVARRQFHTFFGGRKRTGAFSFSRVRPLCPCFTSSSSNIRTHQKFQIHHFAVVVDLLAFRKMFLEQEKKNNVGKCSRISIASSVAELYSDHCNVKTTFDTHAVSIFRKDRLGPFNPTLHIAAHLQSRSHRS